MTTNNTQNAAPVAHTPGPWYVQDNTAQGPNDQLRVDSETHGAIAVVGYGYTVDDEQRANAALIAAAPETARALAESLAREARMRTALEAIVARMAVEMPKCADVDYRLLWVSDTARQALGGAT